MCVTCSSMPIFHTTYIATYVWLCTHAINFIPWDDKPQFVCMCSVPIECRLMVILVTDT